MSSATSSRRRRDRGASARRSPCRALRRAIAKVRNGNHLVNCSRQRTPRNWRASSATRPWSRTRPRPARSIDGRALRRTVSQRTRGWGAGGEVLVWNLPPTCGPEATYCGSGRVAPSLRPALQDAKDFVSAMDAGPSAAVVDAPRSLQRIASRRALARQFLDAAPPPDAPTHKAQKRSRHEGLDREDLRRLRLPSAAVRPDALQEQGGRRAPRHARGVHGRARAPSSYLDVLVRRAQERAACRDVGQRRRRAARAPRRRRCGTSLVRRESGRPREPRSGPRPRWTGFTRDDGVGDVLLR